MFYKKRELFFLFFVLSVFLLSSDSYALRIKVALLAPEGTSWAKSLKKMAKEIKLKTKGAVKIKYYFGGSQGDEADVLRKIRIGQLHGGVFTGKTLGEINGDVRVLELPFNFLDDNDKAKKVISKMAPFFNTKIKKEGFHNLGFFQIGKVYYVSKKKSSSLESLKGQKIWAWQGDELVAAMVASMNLVSVPLALPDVLSSLSTGIVEAAYGPPLGIVSLQWNSKIKYLIDFPISYSVGAFLLSSKTMKKISKENLKIIEDISIPFIEKINQSNLSDNEEAMLAMKSLGVEFIKFPKTEMDKSKLIRKKVVEKLKGTLFSTEAYQKLERNL